MANYPKKTIDPTEAALSAIQEALNIHDDDDAHQAVEAAGAVEYEPAHAPAPEPAFHDLFDSDAVGTRDLRAESARAANDDQQSIGQILQALQRRPPRTSYMVAAVFSAAWIVGCLALSWAYLSDLSAAAGPGHSTAAVMIGLGAAALLPIIFFFGVAHMAWRGQELRLIAQSMAGVAMRLAEPESVARDSIVSVGQAIRREVAAMGDGVERALARASELEAMVQNEVAALARSYGDNEVRIRSLIQDLASQRDTLVGQAEQVRTSINNVHIDLTQDLSTISDLVGQQVNEAAQRITNSLAEKGEHITLSLGQIGDNMIQQLSDRGGDLLERLEATSAETTRAITTASDRLTGSLSFKTDHIGEEFAEIAQGLDDMLSSRLDRITESFSEKSLGVVDAMVSRSQEITDLVGARAQELTDAIVETSSQIADKIAASAEEVNSTLRTSGESLVLDLNLRGGEVATKLEQTGNRITDSLVSRSSKMTDSVRDSAEHLVSVITSRSDAMREMLATRLAAYEQVFSHSGVELGEKISRDATTLGNLITRHLSEFDRTVKTYGSELVERLGARSEDVSESMRSYIDSFDNRVTARANEVTSSLDQRLARFQETLDSRTQSLTEALSTRVMDIAKTLAEGGKEVVGAVDKRVADVTTLIDGRGQKLAETISERVASIDKTLGVGAMQVATTLDGRIEHLEQLLIGRAGAVIEEMDTRSRAAADLLNSRLVELSDAIKTSTGGAERTLTQLLTNTTEALGKSVAATTTVTEALNRSAAEAAASLNRSAGTLSSTITKSATAATEAIDKSTASGTQMLGKSAAAATEAFGRAATSANEVLNKSTATATEALTRTASTASEMLNKSAAGASETIGKTTAVATDLMAKTARASADAIGRSASEAERTLVGMSADVARNIVGRADDIHAAVSQRVGEMTRALDDKSTELLTALTGKSEEFAGEINRVTDQAVKAIEAKGFVFTQTMMDNSEEIARLINDASQNATTAVTRTLGQFQEGTQGIADAAKTSISRTLQDLHNTTRSAIEESKQTAAATVADMLETHSMLRSDSTQLFERLREANILLQEVLSGAHENMNAIEHTMVSRVSEFVDAMNDLNRKSGTATAKVEEHLGAFNSTTVRVLSDLGELATQFSTHGRSLAEAVELLERSNRRTDDSVTARHASIESLVATLDARTDDFEQRLRRFSSLLDESLDSATVRAREIASLVAETSNESVHTIEQQFEVARASAEEQRRLTGETLNTVYQETAGEVQAMFTQSADRFTEIMQGMKQMAAEMQGELEATRAELRRGVLELPQETADNAAQMRRVIVEQIEALAELNRIVARHGRALDAVEPTRREAEPAYAAGGGRGQPRPVRSEISGAPARPARDITGAPTRRPDAPALSPIQGGKDSSGGRGGWLSDMLTRASREESPPITPPTSREAPRTADRPARDAAGSLESLSVDIARMIDHEATADLWERYQRGERGVGNRRLYTAQGQKAFDEIRKKYRGDPEFRQTVEHYIHEFERLLEDVSRGDRGAAVARNYLTSDTGKVYTMLAHAAGRFDQ